MSKNTAYCVLGNKNHIKKDGKYNVKLCVYINRKRYNIGTRIYVTMDDWNKLRSHTLKDKNLKTIRNDIKMIEVKATRVLEKLDYPSKNSFIEAYDEEDSTQDKDPLMSIWFDKYSKKLVRENRPAAYSDHLITSKNSFHKFRKNIRFSDITSEFIEKYTNWMLALHKTYPTVQSYTRDLRTVYHFAIKQKAISGNRNPFGNEIVIGTTVGRKKAITKEQMLKVYNCNLPTGELDLARDIYIFQYLTNGLNILDVCKIKQRNLDHDSQYLTFVRKKTIRTKKNHEEIRAFLPEPARKIIEKWGNKNREIDDFIFPFFNALKGKGPNPRRVRDISQKITKKFNGGLKKISEIVGFPVNITTGVARSSYATISKDEGIEMVHIKEGMGHSTITTTEIYLKSADDEHIKTASSKLL